METVCEPSFVLMIDLSTCQNSVLFQQNPSNPDYLSSTMHYIEHLSKDKKLKKLVEASKSYQLKKRKNICTYLCASIMSQQLSTKVADVIYNRFLALYGSKEPTPQQIVDTPFEILRGIGLSNAKVGYVKNVAQFEMEFGMDHKRLQKMENEEVIIYLTQIKGVGRWTVEMLLMFALGREDIFAIDDLGIQNAMIKLYKLDREDKKKFREDMLRISKKWSPYRTYACKHLWEWKDNAPVVKKIRPKEKIK
jgi:DNA-3-methyladenine glycosylase II